MKKSMLIIALIASFSFGYAINTIITRYTAAATSQKATSIGGIFFKCKDPKKLRAWYQAHLGLNTGPYGTTFEWYQGADSTKKGYTQWSPFKETTTYFAPSTKDYMINYRVKDMDALLAEFKRDSVVIADTITTASYGKFLHIMDLEGNKIELWQPNDIEYAKMGGAITK
jgi:predicted enzyme related to lactoylglutathione lyase